MALPENVHLEIVTPDKQLFSGLVDSVTLPSSRGYLGILPGHAPLLAVLGIGHISYTAGGHTEYLSCCSGFAEILPERVIVLAKTAELASEVDLSRAEKAKARAEKILYSKNPSFEYTRAQLALLRAISRLDAARRFQVRPARRSSVDVVGKNLSGLRPRGN